MYLEVAREDLLSSFASAERRVVEYNLTDIHNTAPSLAPVIAHRLAHTMADAQTVDKVAAAPEVQTDQVAESGLKHEVAAPVTSKKQSLSDIFTIVRRFGLSPAVVRWTLTELYSFALALPSSLMATKTTS